MLKCKVIDWIFGHVLLLLDVCFHKGTELQQYAIVEFLNSTTYTQCPFLGIFVQKLFFIQKAVNLSSKSLLALTKQVSTCFEDFMNIS